MCITRRPSTWPASEPVNQLFGSTHVCTERVALVHCLVTCEMDELDGGPSGESPQGGLEAGSVVYFDV